MIDRGTTAAILAIAAVSGCRQDRVEETEVDLGARVEDVLDHPDHYRGKTVSLAGEIDAVYSDRVFTVGGRDFFGREILIASRAPFVVGELREDDIVHLTGKVNRITIVELERRWKIDLKPDVEMKFSTTPVLIARSVLVSRRGTEEEPERDLFASSATAATERPD